MNTKALKLAAVAATMLEDFVPATWTPLPSLGLGIRVLVGDGQQQLVATAQTGLDRTADTGSAAEAGRVYDTMYPHAEFTWPHLRAITEVEPEFFDTSSPTTVTLIEPLPGAPVGDQAIADTARASSLAQALAILHSAAPESISEAGFPVEDPSRFQFQILERLDQAAATGRVPASLLQHWEEEFEKVSLWRFLATPIHGAIDETSVYTDQERVLALSGIERLRVSDPAIDLAAASALIDPAAVPTFFNEYRNSRPRADEHVITRAELLAEFAVLDWLLEAVDSQDDEAVQDAGDLLTSFNDVLFAKDSTTQKAAAPTSTVGDRANRSGRETSVEATDRTQPDDHAETDDQDIPADSIASGDLVQAVDPVETGDQSAESVSAKPSYRAGSSQRTDGPPGTSKSEIDTEVEPEPEAATKMAHDTEPKSESEPERKSTTGTEPARDTASESGPETESVTETGPMSETESEEFVGDDPDPTDETRRH